MGRRLCLVGPSGFLGRLHGDRFSGEVAGAVRVDPERDDVPDALVVDGGEDGVARGDGDAVEAVQHRLLHLLVGSGDHQHSADRRLP
ncbi:hypothetical protein WJ438_17385 [Streptomyces sp. GD-15H]|uniref:hypothetical protein n=1 Tax=Streptomyces sp. GD-15H TaxID=3129112 RepID=UPI00324FEE86